MTDTINELAMKWADDAVFNLQFPVAHRYASTCGYAAGWKAATIYEMETVLRVLEAGKENGFANVIAWCEDRIKAFYELRVTT